MSFNVHDGCREGYNLDGYDREGYNREGYNRTGYDRDGYDRGGYTPLSCNHYQYRTSQNVVTNQVVSLRQNSCLQ